MTPRRIFAVDVDPSARLLLALLWTWANNDDPQPFVWPSVALLAGHLRCTTRSVRRSLQTLREENLLEPGQRVLAWRHGSHTVRGWILQRMVEQPWTPVTADEEEESFVGQPDVNTWADEIVHLEDREADEIGSKADEIVHSSQVDADDIVTPKRTISSALPSMDLSVVSKRDPAPSAPDVVESVLVLMRDACERLRGRKGAGPDDCDANRKLVARCNKAVRTRGQSDSDLLASWAVVIERQLASVRSRPEDWKYLCLSTLCRPANFLRLRDSVEGKPKRLAAFSVSHDDDE